MSDDKQYNDPTNRVVCIFDDHTKAFDAKAALIEFGVAKDDVTLLRGDSDAAEIDTSAKWFADTDVKMKKFERELRHGASVLAVPVKDSDCRTKVNQILQDHDARQVTHFGDWITEVMR